MAVGFHKCHYGQNLACRSFITVNDVWEGRNQPERVCSINPEGEKYQVCLLANWAYLVWNHWETINVELLEAVFTQSPFGGEMQLPRDLENEKNWICDFFSPCLFMMHEIFLFYCLYFSSEISFVQFFFVQQCNTLTVQSSADTILSSPDWYFCWFWFNDWPITGWNYSTYPVVQPLHLPDKVKHTDG